VPHREEQIAFDRQIAEQPSVLEYVTNAARMGGDLRVITLPDLAVEFDCAVRALLQPAITRSSVVLPAALGPYTAVIPSSAIC
jgi:hypothetical protein